MSTKSLLQFGGLKKSSGANVTDPIEVICRFDGRIIKASDSGRQLLKLLKIKKMNRLLPDDHFELINQALHSGEVVVAANRVNGYSFEWKYFLDQGSKAIRIESIQYSPDQSNHPDSPINVGVSITEHWTNFLDTIPIPACVTENNNDGIIVINQMAMRLLKIAPGNERATKLRNTFSDPNAIKEINKLLVEQGFIKDFKLSISGKSGNRWNHNGTQLLVNIKLVRKVEGSFLVWTFSDYTTGSKVEDALKESENKFENAIQGAQEGIWEWQAGLEGKEWWSEPMFELLGFNSNECEVGLAQMQRLLNPEDREVFNHAWSKLVTTKDSEFLLEARFAVKHKGYRWFVIRATASYDYMGNATKVVGSISDVHLQKQAQSQLANEKDKVVATLRSIVDAVMTTNERGEVQYINEAAKRFLNVTEQEARGKHIDRVLYLYEEESDRKIENPIISCLSNRENSNQKLNADIVTKAGAKFTVQVMATPLISQTGKIYGAVLVMNDVTNLRTLSRRLRYQASHDSLTRLINRSEFERKVRKAILDAKTKRHNSALIYIDLDRFQND